MAKSRFTNSVIAIVGLIPEGKVASYGQVALYAGIPRAALQVGWVLHQYGDDDTTPWWRVINNAGRISTKCVEHNANRQRVLLKKEGIKVTEKLKVDIDKYRWRPNPSTLEKLKLSDDYVEIAIDKYRI